MFTFDQVTIESRKFNSVYQVADNIDLEKVRLSEGIIANKHDTRYTIGYEAEAGRIVPLYIKTPKDCSSSGVGRYNETSPWRMGFDVSVDEAWIKQYEAVWERVQELLGEKLSGEPLGSGKYANPKLITWDGRIRTSFRGISCEPEALGSCYATGVLKIGSVYRQGLNCHLQVFLKECKYRERFTFFESLLSDDDEDSEGYDTVH